MYFWTLAGGSALSRNASLQIRTQEAEAIQGIKVSTEHGPEYLELNLEPPGYLAMMAEEKAFKNSYHEIITLYYNVSGMIHRFYLHKFS